MVNTDAYCAAVGERAFVGAAAGKMLGVVAGLRSVGKRAFLVSLPFLGGAAGRKSISGRLTRGDGIPAAFMPVRRSPASRKLLGTLSFALFCLRTVRREDRVIFYNHAIEYMPALLILASRGLKSFQDIEDVPTKEDRGLAGALSRIAFRWTCRLTSSRKIVVARTVGKSLGLAQYLPVNGVCSDPPSDLNGQKWERLARGEPLKVHFGGTLISSTGLDVFCKAVECLKLQEATLPRPVWFFVTGLGDAKAMTELSERVRGETLRIIPEFGIDRHDYFRVLDDCHVSLSLKAPDSALAATTFPSKVIEITSHGIALVTTNISDIPDLFDESSAYLLSEFDGAHLARIIRNIAEHPDKAMTIAAAGKMVAQSRFSKAAIGRALADFIEVDAL